MIRKLLSYAYVSYFFVTSAFLVWISAAIWLFTKDRDPLRRMVHMYSCWWGFHYIKVNPGWKTTFEGVENIEWDKTYVLVSNHQSLWDIMVLYGLNRPYKWVSKENVFKMPFIGWNMYFNQYVKIARGDLKSIKEMMATCKGWLNKGASIMIFPEGTRSEDGELLEFRDGPFKMATDCNVPVIPIVIEGTRKCLPKGTLMLDFVGDIKVRVLPPVYPKDFESVKKMRDHVRATMQSTLSEMRGKTAITSGSDQVAPKESAGSSV